MSSPPLSCFLLPISEALTERVSGPHYSAHWSSQTAGSRPVHLEGNDCSLPTRQRARPTASWTCRARCPTCARWQADCSLERLGRSARATITGRATRAAARSQGGPRPRRRRLHCQQLRRLQLLQKRATGAPTAPNVSARTVIRVYALRAGRCPAFPGQRRWLSPHLRLLKRSC